MNKEQNQRRNFIKAGLLTPLLAGTSLREALAAGPAIKELDMPQHIRDAVTKVYGSNAEHIICSSTLILKAPDIAENGAVVPIGIHAEPGMVRSVVILAEKNTEPFVTQCKVYEDTCLPISIRIKIGRSSNVYAIAETKHGLIGSVKYVRYTVGCGGG